VNDDRVEGAHLGRIQHSVSGLNVGDVTVNITDNDVAGIRVIADGLGALEEGAQGVYRVALNSEPQAEVSVQIDVDENLLVSGRSTLVFTPEDWSEAQTVIIVAVDNAAVDGDRTARVTHVAASDDGTYAGLTAPLSVGIKDNDSGFSGETPVMDNFIFLPLIDR
jgi:hypothetical protein